MRKQLFFISVLTIFSIKMIAQTILGIDVYNGTGVINWSQVAADGKVFAYAKATEGVTFNDARFATNMTNGTNAGIIMGGYHFWRPDNNSAVDDANHFIAVVSSYYNGNECRLPPALDLENPVDGNGNEIDLRAMYSISYLTSWAQTWLTTVNNALGVAPIVYTNSDWAGDLTSTLNSNTYGLWIAKPGSSPTTQPTGLGIWSTWIMKQYSWTGSVSGISGAVLLDVFNGTSNDFNNWIVDCGSSEDITVTNTSVSTTIIACGNDVDVQSDHTYSGNELDTNLPSFDLDYYLSTDCNYDGGDVSLGNGESSSLGSDDPVNNETATLTIPSGTSQGNYYILFVGDADDELTSENENNNVACEQITVTCGTTQADITVNNTSVTSTTIICGNDVDVQSDHTYSGNELDTNLPSFDLDYYLSTDCNYDGGDVSLGNGESSSLGSDDPVNNETATLTIPPGTSPGSYYILFVGDADDELTSENENNNVACEQITVTCPNSDLEITTASASPTTLLCPGDEIVIDYTITNTGGAPTITTQVGFYLIPVSNGCPSSIPSNSPFDDGALTASEISNGSENESYTRTIPASISSGSYYLALIADWEEILSESSEGNNINCDILITINSLSNCAPTIVISGDETICQGSEITLTADCNPPCTSYDWSTGSTDQQITITTGGTYSVTGSNGGTDSHSVTEVNTTPPCPTGITNLNEFIDLTIFPNPSNGIFTIKLKTPSEKEIQVSVVNILGQEIYRTAEEKVIGEYSKYIELKDISTGVYFVRVKVGEELANQKIIVR